LKTGRFDTGKTEREAFGTAEQTWIEALADYKIALADLERATGEVDWQND